MYPVSTVKDVPGQDPSEVGSYGWTLRYDVSAFKSVKQTQKLLEVRAAGYKLFNLTRHLVSAETYGYLRSRSFASWKTATMV